MLCLAISCLRLRFFSSSRRQTRCALVTGVQTCALPISAGGDRDRSFGDFDRVQRRLVAAMRDVDEHLLLFHLSDNRRAIVADAAIDTLGAARTDHVLCIIGELRAAQTKAAEQRDIRSEEHTSELQSLMRISYAVFCLKTKTRNTNTHMT